MEEEKNLIEETESQDVKEQDVKEAVETLPETIAEKELVDEGPVEPEPEKELTLDDYYEAAFYMFMYYNGRRLNMRSVDDVRVANERVQNRTSYLSRSEREIVSNFCAMVEEGFAEDKKNENKENFEKFDDIKKKINQVMFNYMARMSHDDKKGPRRH